LLRNAAQLTLPVGIWLPLALAVFIGLQAVLMPQVVDQHAAMAVAYLGWAALLMALTGLLQQSLGRERLSAWVAGSLLTAALWASGRELLARLTGEADVWGGLGQPNHYGDLVALGGASLLYLQAAGKLPRVVFIALGMAIMMGLSLSPSRTVWLYWAAVALIVWQTRSGSLRPLLIGFIAYLAFQALWSVLPLPTSQAAINTTAAERLLQQASGTSARWHIWQVAWQLFLQQPLFGHGFGQFDWAYFDAGHFLAEQPTRIEHAHNLILHVLAELGVMPVILLILAAIQWLKPWLTSQPDNYKTAPGCQALRGWLLMLFAILGLHSMVEYPLWHASFLGIAAVLLGLGEHRFWTLRAPHLVSTLTGAMLTLALAVAARHEWQYVRMEMALMAGIIKPSLQQEQQLVAICQEVPDKSPLLLPYVPVLFTLTGHPESEEMRPNLRALAEAAARFTPSNNLVYRLSLVQALNGEHDAALATLNKAMAAYPATAVTFVVEVMRLQETNAQHVGILLKTLVPFVNRSLKQARTQTASLKP
jgi:O-antigen ligase